MKANKKDLRNKCLLIAFDHENLFPHICIDIIGDVFGESQMEKLKPSYLNDLVSDMMRQVTDATLETECINAVNEYLNDY